MRTIGVVTTSRADYGIYLPLLRRIEGEAGLELRLLVTGMHLSPEFGMTVEAIEADGFEVHEKVEMLLSSDTPEGIAKSMGLGVIGFAEVFSRFRPDILVVLGDRFEMFAAALAALPCAIPMAHIHGGESTEGLIDEAVRHSITKLAHLHFVAAEQYRKRVIQLGESPSRVFNFGALALDNIKELQLLGRAEFENATGIQLRERSFLVTYHPVTLSKRNPEEVFGELTKALDYFPEARVIFTRQNADTYGRGIGRVIDNYVAQNPGRVSVFVSLGQVHYLSAIRHVDVVIGNSSSGLIEVPAFKKPTVNIGERQRGRLRASSVIDCPESAAAIADAIRKALSSTFQAKLSGTVSPYGQGNAAGRIADVLRTHDLEGILFKEFHVVRENC